jgi:subtilisin-like proprotein convertase family protein
MKAFASLACIFFSSAVSAQGFAGSTGQISDDGSVSNYTATVSGLAPLGNGFGLVKVCLDISHTYDSDLNVHLISPSGIEINLFSGLGGGDDNFTGTCLSQSGETSINAGIAPFTGVFRPQESLGNENTGQSGNGVWTLKVVDTYPFADTGTVNAWSLEFGNGAESPFIFTESNLPIVTINTNGIDIPDEPKIDAVMGIIDNGAGQINHVSDLPNGYDGNIGIELRGNYSQGLPQKPYNFETRDNSGQSADAAILGMPAEHDWCLIATYNDKVFMRNALAYQLFAQMGNYAARTRFCEVMLNGSYQGIYLLAEKIKRDNNRVDIAKLDPDENTGPEVTGGYILKSDYWTDQDSWQLQFHPPDHPERDVRLVYEYPKPEAISDPQKQYIQGFINNMETALYGDNFADPANGYAKYLDTDSFIDYFIVNELSRNIDGFRKSWFFSKDKDESIAGTGKLRAGPVWDFDWAWKDIWSCPIFEATDGSGWAHQINDCDPDVASNGWYFRLLQDPAFANRLRCRWESFRSTFMSNGALNDYIDQTAGLLDEAQARHFGKWGNLGVNTGTPEVEQDPATFAGQIAQFKDWVSRRLEWLDDNIPGSADGCALGMHHSQELDMSAYPNPANEILRFRFGRDAAIRAEIFDATGKMVLSSEIKNASLDVSALAGGMYFCRLTTADSGSQIIKIAIMH